MVSKFISCVKVSVFSRIGFCSCGGSSAFRSSRVGAVSAVSSKGKGRL